MVDEAWTLMREPDGARFLARMAKSARKRRAGLTVVTQDAADLLGSDLGQAVVANAATQILMRQAPQAIDAVAAAFGLTTGEARLLLAADRGDALLLAGATRVAFHAIACPSEHDLAAGTDPGAEAGRRDAVTSRSRLAVTTAVLPAVAGTARRRIGCSWSVRSRSSRCSPRSGTWPATCRPRLAAPPARSGTPSRS